LQHDQKISRTIYDKWACLMLVGAAGFEPTTPTPPV
jgi:hypothetical protein